MSNPGNSGLLTNRQKLEVVKDLLAQLQSLRSQFSSQLNQLLESTSLEPLTEKSFQTNLELERGGGGLETDPIEQLVVQIKLWSESLTKFQMDLEGSKEVLVDGQKTFFNTSNPILGGFKRRHPLQTEHPNLPLKWYRVNPLEANPNIVGLNLTIQEPEVVALNQRKLQLKNLLQSKGRATFPFQANLTHLDGKSYGKVQPIEKWLAQWSVKFCNGAHPFHYSLATYLLPTNHFILIFSILSVLKVSIYFVDGIDQNNYNLTRKLVSLNFYCSTEKTEPTQPSNNLTFQLLTQHNLDVLPLPPHVTDNFKFRQSDPLPFLLDYLVQFKDLFSNPCSICHNILNLYRVPPTDSTVPKSGNSKEKLIYLPPILRIFDSQLGYLPRHVNCTAK